MIIAIDGPAASGKGTIAKQIAKQYGLCFLDTGLLYRAVAHETISKGFLPNDTWAVLATARNIEDISLDNPLLRTIKIGESASIVACLPEVRQQLLKYQRSFAKEKADVVLDGRDIGTVVLPEAHIKIFVTASPEVRARRRYLERKSLGESVSYEEILMDIQARDTRDSNRTVAPLRPAEDALLLDTTDLDIENAFKTAVQLIKRKIGH
ncbi:MAG: (d)CMP kinase [Hyphomicrobium sp.]